MDEASRLVLLSSLVFACRNVVVASAAGGWFPTGEGVVVADALAALSLLVVLGPDCTASIILQVVGSDLASMIAPQDGAGDARITVEDADWVSSALEAKRDNLLM
jgi:hypothetical protein